MTALKMIHILNSAFKPFCDDKSMYQLYFTLTFTVNNEVLQSISVRYQNCLSKVNSQ